MNIKYVDYNTDGYTLSIPEFMVTLWPDCLQPDDWPTFCGAGDGIGDDIVPDTIFGVRICPACFIHDISWVLADNNWSSFQRENNRFRRNLISIVTTKISDPVIKILAIQRCNLYWLAVSTVGWFNFKKDPDDRVEVKDPISHPVVISKLRRLGVIK